MRCSVKVRVDKMKITKIKTAEKSSAAVKGTAVQDSCLYLFRSPVIFTIGGKDRIFGGDTAILYEGGFTRDFRSSGSRELKYDLVQFRPTSADRQYMKGLDIPLNTPVEVPDSYTLASAIKNMSIYRQGLGKHRAELGELYMRIILIALEEAFCGIEREEINIPRYPQLKEIRQELYDNPIAEWSVDMLCRRLAVSRTYFHRIYMAAFGVTFRQDAIESRLALACELLIKTELAVSVIAEKCGYESESYFMKQFKQHKGCTPSEYRRRQ